MWSHIISSFSRVLSFRSRCWPGERRPERRNWPHAELRWSYVGRKREKTSEASRQIGSEFTNIGRRHRGPGHCKGSQNRRSQPFTLLRLFRRHGLSSEG